MKFCATLWLSSICAVLAEYACKIRLGALWILNIIAAMMFDEHFNRI